MSAVRFRTNRRTWIVASCCVFSLLGAVDFTRGATSKDVFSFWSLLSVLLRMPNIEAAFFVATFGLVLTVVSALFGWVIQAAIAATFGFRTSPPTPLVPDTFRDSGKEFRPTRRILLACLMLS